jgi:16S rRNA (cytosine967-C5)-methyltransferase
VSAEPAAERSRVAPARRAAYEVLRRVFEHGAWADRALPAAVRRNGLDARDRALAQRLTYGAVQRRGTSDHLIELLADRDAAEIDSELVAALRLGLYELLFAGGTPDHAAVDQAVELAKNARPASGRGAGLVNALLRRTIREREALLGGLGDATPAEAAIAHSHPEWLAEMWWRELGADIACSLMAADNEPAETALRVNTLRRAPEDVIGALRAGGVEAQRPEAAPPLVPPESVVVRGALAEAGTSLIEAGDVFPQARASAAVVSLLDPRPGERVLDLCAGPGIKTTQIAARMSDQGEVVSVERDARRCEEIGELCRRVGAESVRPVCADASRDDAGGGYDRILVDPPCSDLGTLASRPDARWRKSPEQIRELADLQASILARGATALRPGGTLVYSTCTISVRENEEVVNRVREHADPSLVADELGAQYRDYASPHDQAFLQTRPDRDGTDGFFIARLRREG